MIKPISMGMIWRPVGKFGLDVRITSLLFLEDILFFMTTGSHSIVPPQSLYWGVRTHVDRRVSTWPH